MENSKRLRMTLEELPKGSKIQALSTDSVTSYTMWYEIKRIWSDFVEEPITNLSSI